MRAAGSAMKPTGAVQVAGSFMSRAQDVKCLLVTTHGGRPAGLATVGAFGCAVEDCPTSFQARHGGYPARAFLTAESFDVPLTGHSLPPTPSPKWVGAGPPCEEVDWCTGEAHKCPNDA